MNKTLNFLKRNLKEVFRDPIIYIFCLGFPVLMFLLFHIINGVSSGNTPTFEILALLPGILTFSYSFIMLTLALNVSKDRQTFFLKRLYSSPMKPLDFILGYFLVGLIIGLIQTAVCFITAFILAICTKAEFISITKIFLLTLEQLPVLTINIFFGILFGTLFNDKTAPGICSVLISVSGILGGCWMPVEVMGGFETFCRLLPYYPSVYIGRIITGAKSALNAVYEFNQIAILGLITIFIYLIILTVVCVETFKNSMKSDN